jgi:hypothetical protein
MAAAARSWRTTPRPTSKGGRHKCGVTSNAGSTIVAVTVVRRVASAQGGVLLSKRAMGGLLLLVAALFGIFGVVQGTTSVSQDGVSCGSVFGANKDLLYQTLTSNAPSTVFADCDQARSGRKPMTLGLMGAAGLLLLASIGLFLSAVPAGKPVEPPAP